jgi:hypothetical protein
MEYFVVGIGEEGKPILSPVKDFRDENQIRTVLFG